MSAPYTKWRWCHELAQLPGWCHGCSGFTSCIVCCPAVELCWYDAWTQTIFGKKHRVNDGYMWTRCYHFTFACHLTWQNIAVTKFETPVFRHLMPLACHLTWQNIAVAKFETPVFRHLIPLPCHLTWQNIVTKSETSIFRHPIPLVCH
jgi:hypothetical protein